LSLHLVLFGVGRQFNIAVQQFSAHAQMMDAAAWAGSREMRTTSRKSAFAGMA
jgi:hypothetical protein